jgi:hypothetical protein
MARNRGNRGSGAARPPADRTGASRDPQAGRPDQPEKAPDDKAREASAPGGSGTPQKPVAPGPAQAGPSGPPEAKAPEIKAPEPKPGGVPSISAPSIDARPASGQAGVNARPVNASAAGGGSTTQAAASPGGASTPTSGAPARPAGAPPSGAPAGGAGRPPTPPGGGPGQRGAAPVGPPARPSPAGAPAGGMGRGFGAGLVGGLIGGAIAALLVAAWFQSGDQLDALRARVDQLDSTVASATGDSGELASLAGRIEALETGATPPDLSGRMAEIEAALAQLPASADAPLGKLEQRITALESESAPGGADQADAVKALQQQLTALASQEAARVEDTSAKLQQATGKLQDVESRLGQLDQRLAAAEQTGTQLQQLSATVDQLSQKASADAQQSQELAGRIGVLDQRVSGTETKVQATNQARDRAAALALIVAQLQTALEDAQPYQAPLDALAAMAGDDGAIRSAADELQASASSGVPTMAALRQSFVPVAEEIVGAARAPEGDSLIDQAAGNLMRLVTVRPAGSAAEGDSVDARVARAEASLNDGDLAAAVTELDQLEGEPAPAAAEWLAHAKARLTAEQAVSQLRSQATDLLTQTN